MGITTSVLTIPGLALFEAITSVDNALINAEALVTMKAIHDSAPVLLIGGGYSSSFSFVTGSFLSQRNSGCPERISSPARERGSALWYR